jgi:hypothetical protein
MGKVYQPVSIRGGSVAPDVAGRQNVIGEAVLERAMLCIKTIALLLAVAPSLALAGPIQVGSASIEIPVPPGFVLVVPEMKQVSESLRRFTPPDHTLFAVFIAEIDAPQALADEFPLLQRRFTIQAPSKSVGVSVMRAEFAQLKKGFASEFQLKVDDLKNRLPDLVSRISKAGVEQMDPQLVTEIGGIVPFAPHYDDEHSLSLSMIFRTEVTAADSESVVALTAATMTLVRVRDRVLFVYVYGGKDDIVWTRKASQEWVYEIVKANESNFPGKSTWPQAAKDE